MPTDGSVIFEDLTNSTGVLVLAGPKARELMLKVSTDDFSNENFKWLTAQNVEVGYAPVNAMRVNFVGELGWELHHPFEYSGLTIARAIDLSNLKPNSPPVALPTTLLSL